MTLPQQITKLEIHCSINLDDAFSVFASTGGTYGKLEECQLFNDNELKCHSEEPIHSVRIVFREDIDQPFELHQITLK